MKGSIRIIAGLIIAYAGMGTADQSTTTPAMMMGVTIALVGLGIMYMGVRATKS